MTLSLDLETLRKEALAECADQFERIDTIDDMASSPFADLFSGSQGDQSHYSPQ